MEYISLQAAANLCSYSQEYLSLRARQRKLKAVKFGRAWSTTKEWLQEYIARAERSKPDFKQKEVWLRTIDPPANLPIYAPDADMWEDEMPEDVARQKTFQEKFQFAFATLCVAVLFCASVLIGQQQVFRVAEKVSPLVIESALVFQEEVQERGFAIGNAMKVSISLAGVGEIAQEYVGWLSNQIRSIAQIFRSDTKLVVPSNPVVPRLDLARQAAPAGRGLVVLPSSEDNANVKEQITQSFSDEVVVTPYDEESGIITPVFRHRKGEDYLYILVPIQGNNQ